MTNQNTLIAQILSTPPYQLPPVHHGNGVYSLDISYKGDRLCKVGVSLDEVLDKYYRFVTKLNYIRHDNKEPLKAHKPPDAYSTSRPISLVK